MYKWGRVVLIILAVFLGVQTLAGLRDLREINPAYNSITVSGEGEIFAVPDVASFSFGVKADADTVTEAQEMVTTKMDAVLAQMKALGVEEKDIKTTNYSVYPKYVYSPVVCTSTFCPPGRETQDGFTASHSVTIKVRKTDDAGAILGAAGEAGATDLSSINFTVDDPEVLKAQARALAIENAKQKAKVLTEDLNVRLVRVVSFSDSSDGGYPAPFYRAEAVSVDMAQSVAVAPTLPTGENQIRVVVNVTYEIR